MQIILLEKVNNLGGLGDVVRVKDGFARNFLIPQRMARRATTANIAEFAGKRAELEKAAADKLAAAQAVGEKLTGQDDHHQRQVGRGRPTVRFGDQRRHRRSARQAGLQGREGASAPARWSTLKTIGEHAVSVSLHTDVSSDITIAVVGEAGLIRPSSCRVEEAGLARLFSWGLFACDVLGSAYSVSSSGAIRPPKIHRDPPSLCTGL